MKKRIGPKNSMKSAASLKSDKKKKKRDSDNEFTVSRTPKLKAEPVEGKREKKKMAKLSSQLKNQLSVIGEVSAREVKKSVAENFGEAAPQIIDLLEMNDNDGAIVVLQKRLLQSSIAMLVHAEKLMVSTEGAKGTYQYATLVSQIRELITDIQAARDRSFIANQIIQQIIQPAFIDLAEMVMNSHQGFRKDMLDDEIVDSEMASKFNTSLRDLARSMAQKMQVKYRDIEIKVMQQLTS